LRLFIAVDIEESLRRRVAAELPRLRTIAGGARWARPEVMHVTLVFLGEVDDATAPRVEERARAVAARHPPLTLRARGAGIFGKPRGPRVLWIGLEGDLGRLAQVQQDLSRELEPLGFAPEARAFSPHLTLARSRAERGDPALSACNQALAGVDWGESRASDLVIYRSELSRDGPRYTAMARLGLRGPSSDGIGAP
jgi:RNA 2',3'-cyclic 3'-phosphodiesterase